MRDGWNSGRLADFATVSTGPFGSVLHKSDYVSDGVPLVNPINIVGERIVPNPEKLIGLNTAKRLTGYTLQLGDVAVGRRGEIGRCAVIGPDEAGWICGTGCFFLRPNATVEPHFLASLIRSDYYRQQLEESSTGATIKSLSNALLGNLRIAVPSLPEQQRIVAILDEAFAGIATAKANAEKNLQNARALFDSHLRASLTPRDDSWKPATLGDVCSITSALIHPRDDQFSDLLHVGAGNMVSGTGELVALQTAREEKLISGKFPFDASMVLYSKIRPYLLKVARPDFAGICSADVYPLAPLAGQMDRDFLFYLLRGPAFTEYAIAGSARAGMPKVNREHLFAFQTYLPSVEQQALIARKLDMIADAVKQVVANYQRKLAALDELKQSLLAKAFAGELC